jgi:hypothetical protein
MNRIRFYVICMSLSLLSFSAAAICHAQSPFDGTWRIDPNKAKFDQKPFTVYLSQGWYHCVSCTPSYDIAADGQLHPVIGQSEDAESVTVVDPHTLAFVDQKGGKTIAETNVSVSPDGKILTLKTKSYPLNGDAAQSSSMSLKRAGVLPAGVHGVSGNWVPLKFSDTDADLSFSYKLNGDELTMTDPTGDSYTAKFDGSDYPFKSYGADAVSLKKVDARTIIETDKRNGKVISINKMTVSADGKSMTSVVNDPNQGTTSTFVATKK